VEEKQSQDLEKITEETEKIPEAFDVALEEAAAETAEPVEEPIEENSIEEKSVEENPIEENPIEEVSAEEIAKEDAVAETVSEEETEKLIAKEPAGDVEANAFQEEPAPQKQATAGIVLKPWQLAVAAVVVVALVVGGVVLGIVLGNKNNSNFDDSPVDYDWILEEGGQTHEDQIILPGYVELTFPAGEQEIEIVLPNPKGNPCYFRYTLIMESTGEILYQSRLIPPGQAVLQIKLSRPLEKGDYSLLIGVDTVSLADGRTPMNGGEQKVLLKVR